MRQLRPHLLQFSLLIAASCAVYLQALGHDFLVNWDDAFYVTNNEMIKGVSVAHLVQIFTSFRLGNYAPLHLLSYLLDYELWGLRPAGFIFTNILLHTINSCMYYALMLKLEGRKLVAFLAACIFLLHPVQVESVVWIAERKNVLAMTFFLAAFLSYVSYREKQRGGGWYVTSVAAFVGALLSKPVAVILPLVLFLYDRCYANGNGRKRGLASLTPYVVLAGVFAVIAIRSQAPEFYGGRTAFHGGSPFTTLLTMLPIETGYIGLLLWPVKLSAIYNPPIKYGPDIAVTMAALFLVGCCGGGVYLYRRHRNIFFWGAVYFIGLLPVSQIIPLVSLMNDRYLYFPLLGAAAFLVLVLFRLAQPLARGRDIVTVALMVVILALAVVSYRRVGVWQDAVTLWSDTVAKVPYSEEACLNFAGAFAQSGRLKSATDCLAIAEVYERGGFLGEARTAYVSALSYDPAHRDALFGLGRVMLKRGDATGAEPYLRRLVRAYPQFAEGYAALANDDLLAGKPKDAVPRLEKAVQLGVHSVDGLFLLGDAYLRLFRIDQACQYYRQALALAPERGDIHNRLAIAEAVRGRKAEAYDELKTALQLGYADRQNIAKNPLLKLPEFERLVGRYPLRE